MFINKNRYQNKRQFQINKNLGINAAKNNIKEFINDVNLNQQILEHQINKNIKNKNIFENLEVVQVLNKEIDVTSGKIAELRDYGIYTIADEPMFSISGERLETIK